MNSAQYFEIYVCDRDPRVRRLVCDSLSEYSFKITEFSDGEEALKAIEAGNIPHMMFCDFDLSTNSGFPLFSSAAKHSKHIEIVLLLENDATSHIKSLSQRSFDNFLIKPIASDKEVQNKALKCYEHTLYKSGFKFLKKQISNQKNHSQKLASFVKELKAADTSKNFSDLLSFFFKGVASNDEDINCVFFRYCQETVSLELKERYPERLFSVAYPKWAIPKKEAGPDKIKFLSELSNSESFRQFNADLASFNTNSENITFKSFYPVIVDNTLRGVLAFACESKTQESLTEITSPYVDLFLKIYKLEEQKQWAFKNSIYQSSTQIFNTHYLKQIMAREQSRSRRYGYAFTVAAIKFTESSKSKESYVDFLNSQLRSTDFIFYSKKGYFFCLLPQTVLSHGLSKMSQVAAELSSQSKQSNSKETLRAVCSEFPSHFSSAETIIEELCAQIEFTKTTGVFAFKSTRTHTPLYRGQHTVTQKF